MTTWKPYEWSPVLGQRCPSDGGDLLFVRTASKSQPDVWQAEYRCAACKDTIIVTKPKEPEE